MDPAIQQIKIVSPDGAIETVYAEHLGVDTYRLLENPIFSCDINYGTTVKVNMQENGDLIVSKLIRASDYITKRFLLSSTDNQNDIQEKISDKIIQAGGTWEIAMGGFVFINIPKNSSFNLKQLFKETNFFPTEIIDEEKNGA